MIEPPGGIFSLRTINDPTIVQPEIESVSVLSGGARIGILCAPPRDELALVLEYECPGLDVSEHEHAAAMYRGTADYDAAHGFEMAVYWADLRTLVASP
jgi:hypothetical protein